MINFENNYNENEKTKRFLNSMVSQKQQEQMKIRELIETIENGRKQGKRPLFLIGSGISPKEIPKMDRIFKYFSQKIQEIEKHLSHKSGTDIFNNLKEIETQVRRITEDQLYQSRAEASKLFGSLQNSKFEVIKENVWKKFLKDFVFCFESNIPIWTVPPTEVHRYIAKEIMEESLPGVCISVNFDGLMAKAIHEIWKEGSKETYSDMEPLFPCRILSSWQEVRNYFVRNKFEIEENGKIYPLFKIRGDVFNAVCRNEACKYYNQLIPIFTFENNVLIGGNAPQQKEKILHQVLRCKGCGGKREIELNFIGDRKKTEEVRLFLIELSKFLLTSISCIVVVGFSGKWDPEIIEFLHILFSQRELRIYCIDKADVPSLRKEMKAENNSNRFIHICMDAQEAIKTMKEMKEKIKNG